MADALEAKTAELLEANQRDLEAFGSSPAKKAMADRLSLTDKRIAEMAAGITVKPEAMERAAMRGYATATDLADYLVKKGLPFRDAHETVAHAVKAASSHNCDLSELPLHVPTDRVSNAVLELEPGHPTEVVWEKKKP